MGIEKYNLTCKIAKPADVWGYASRPDSFVWTLASSMSNYSNSPGRNVIYNSALKCFMLRPIPGSTNMLLANWDIITGKWLQRVPTDLNGTFLRQYEMVDWGIESKTAIIRVDGCFSIYIRRPPYKNTAIDDSEYQTIGLNDGTTERKFKFWRNGTIEFLTNGTQTETRTVKQSDIQKWRDSNVVQLDFYTLGNAGGVTKMLITSPILSEAIVVDKVVSDSVASKIIINGKNGALVGYSQYTFVTSGDLVFNSMSELTDGTADSGVSPQVRSFPAPAVGNTVTSALAWITSGSGKAVFKPIVTFTGSGYNPILTQAIEFGFIHTWTAPASPVTWYDISENVVSISESIPDNITGRTMTIELVFTDTTKAQAFKDNFALCSSNPFTPACAFEYILVQGSTTLLVHGGILQIGNEIHANDQFATLTCNVVSRLQAQGTSDALTVPVSCGQTAENFWKQSLAVAGINPNTVIVTDTGTFPDAGWDYDTLQMGVGDSISGYLSSIAQARGVVLDDKNVTTISVRPDPVAFPTSYTIATTAGYNLNQRVESLAMESGNEEYCNSLSIIMDGERYQEIFRAYCPDAIAADGRIIHRTMQRNDFAITGTQEAENEIRKILELTQQVNIDVPPTGLIALYPGTTQLNIVTDEIYGLGDINGSMLIVSEIEINIETAGDEVIFSAIANAKRKASVLTIETEQAFYAQGGQDANTAKRDNGAWTIKQEKKKDKRKETHTHKKKSGKKVATVKNAKITKGK